MSRAELYDLAAEELHSRLSPVGTWEALSYHEKAKMREAVGFVVALYEDWIKHEAPPAEIAQ